MLKKVDRRTDPFAKIYRSDCFVSVYQRDLLEFPLVVDVESTNACNLECIMCNRNVMVRPVGFMTFETFQTIVDEVSQYPDRAIRFGRWGEPTLNRQLPAFIRYAKSRGLLVHLTTNGIYQRPNVVEDLVDSGLDKVKFSFQGTTKAEYQRIRVNTKYDQLVAAIKRMVEYRDSRGCEHPFVQVSTSVLDETQEEINAFIGSWANIVDSVYYGYTSFNGVKHTPDGMENLPRQKAFFMGGVCKEPMTKLSVNWNGDVTTCCSDVHGEMVLGNLRDHSLKEFWTCERERWTRETLRKDEKYKIHICSQCTGFF